MPQTAALEKTATPAAQAVRCVDCDVHPSVHSNEAFAAYLPEPWRSRGGGGPSHGFHNPHGVHRRDAYRENGRSIASDPEATQREHLDRYGIDRGILIPSGALAASTWPDPDAAAAHCRASNDYFLKHWVEPHERYYGSISISTRDIDGAVREVERLAGAPRLVQVAIGSAQPMPLGERYFHPLYEACARHNLPIAIHPGSEGAGVASGPTAAGWVSRYLAWHTCLAQNFQAHLVSLITEGVFERFPKLRFVLVEGGVAWLPPLLWRFDKNWKALRSETPWVKRPPSEYLAGHVRLTTQPIEEPAKHEHLKQLFGMLDFEHLLFFASDFPHWDGDTPDFALRGFDETFKQRVLAGNACEFYGIR